MGKGTFRVNVLGNRTNHVASFLAMGDSKTTMTASQLTTKAITNTGASSSSTVTATSYITVGTNKYLFPTTAGSAATILANATALVGTPVKGSLALGAGTLWFFDSDTSVKQVNATALT